MSCCTRDLTIDGVLADPLIAAAMRADRVDPRGFEDLLRTTARRIAEAPRPKASLRSALAGRSATLLTGARPRW